MGKRSELDPKQRAEAVLALLRREEPGVRIARRYGVSEPTLYRWRDEFLQAGEAALAGTKNGQPAERVAAGPQGRGAPGKPGFREMPGRRSPV